MTQSFKLPADPDYFPRRPSATEPTSSRWRTSPPFIPAELCPWWSKPFQL